MPGPVRALVSERGVEALGIAENLDRRHLDGVGTGGVVGAISAVADHAFVAAKNSSAWVMRFDRREFAFDPGVIMSGQTLDLFDVEDGVAFEERDFALGVLAGGVVMLGPLDGVGVDDQRSLFALADMARSTQAPV